jgi:hypothetical protein
MAKRTTVSVSIARGPFSDRRDRLRERGAMTALVGIGLTVFLTLTRGWFVEFGRLI